MAAKMKAAVFVEPGRIVLDEKPVPPVGPLDALVRVTTTTSCGTDLHILTGEYPVAKGLTIGHEPVGVIEKLGAAVKGYREGERVIAGAMTNLAPVPDGGADHLVDIGKHDPIEEILRITDGRGVDAAVEAPGTRQTFEACLRLLRPGGTLRFELDAIESAYEFFGH